MFTGFLRRVLPSVQDAEIEERRIKRILVVRQHDQLGDMLCAVPLLQALHNRFPKSSITLIASPVNHRIMLNHPYLAEVINYDKRILRRSLPALWRFYRVLSSREFDLAVVPSTVSLSMTSDLIARLSGARYRIGPKRLGENPNPTSFCYTHAVDLDWVQTPRRHQSLRNLDILAPLHLPEENLPCVIGITDEEQNNAGRYLAELRKRFPLLVGIHPGAGKRENRWQPEKFASVANRLFQDYKAGILITAGPMDEEPVRAMQTHLTCESVVVENKPIREVAAIINNLDLFITNDTGIMHVAGAVKANVLAIFGPTDPLQWAPIGQKNRYIAAGDRNIASLSAEEVYNIISIILAEIRR